MNFFKNRTTNERYSKRKIATQNGKSDRMSVTSEVTNDSTGSSLLSAIQQLKAAEDIL